LTLNYVGNYPRRRFLIWRSFCITKHPDTYVLTPRFNDEQRQTAIKLNARNFLGLYLTVAYTACSVQLEIASKIQSYGTFEPPIFLKHVKVYKVTPYKYKKKCLATPLTSQKPHSNNNESSKTIKITLLIIH
jgi:hypothetical protein